jgi:hypothetical protein
MRFRDQYIQFIVKAYEYFERQKHRLENIKMNIKETVLMMGTVSRSAILNRCAAVYWCDAKGPKVCRGSLGEGRKERRKNLRNKKNNFPS